jgi:hypothetical protein
MTAATTKAPARKPAEKGSLDYLQQALDDLAHARGQAQQEARAGIDSAAHLASRGIVTGRHRASCGPR